MKRPSHRDRAVPKGSCRRLLLHRSRPQSLPVTYPAARYRSHPCTAQLSKRSRRGAPTPQGCRSAGPTDRSTAGPASGATNAGTPRARPSAQTFAAGAYGRAAFDSVGPAAADRLGRDRTRTAAPPVRRPPPPARSGIWTRRDAGRVGRRYGWRRGPSPDPDGSGVRAHEPCSRPVRCPPGGPPRRYGHLGGSRRPCSPKQSGSTASTASGTAARSLPRRCARKCESVPPALARSSSRSVHCTTRRRGQPVTPAANQISGTSIPGASRAGTGQRSMNADQRPQPLTA